VLAYSGARHHYNRFAEGLIDGEPLQLVQALHVRTPDRWLERSELTTDDLDRMFWDRLRRRGAFVASGQITAEWVDHPHQRHKLLREPEGGINPYRVWYGVQEPLRMQTTAGNLIDEPRRYRTMRERPDTPAASDGLRILLVGELAYNADRVLALEERGHRLFGLWLPEPQWYNTVGPLAFGHVTDIPLAGWRDAVRRIEPDVIYALLNWQAVPFARRILDDNPGIPFVWHFKEGPFICLEKGTWADLIELYRRADGRISTSAELRDWFATVAPETATGAPHLALDGDLPKREWFGANRSPLRSDVDGEIHTVVPGRPIGLYPPTVAELAAHRVHLHFYGDFTQRQWAQWVATTRRLAPEHLHLHSNVDQEDWTREFSQYDAGWLHAFASRNGGEIRRADWDDLNLPARMATLAAAGLPMIQRDNAGAIVAAQSVVRRLDCGIFYHTIPELAERLRDHSEMARLRDNAWTSRDTFTFDAHTDDLIALFRQVIASKRTTVGSPAAPKTAHRIGHAACK
jgi:hypothetical protein